MTRALALSSFWLAWAIASWLLPYDPAADVDFSLGRGLPSWAQLLGTDHAGRDLGLRLVAGAGAFLGPGLLGASLAVGLGTVLGAAIGWGRGPRATSAVRAAGGRLATLSAVPTVLPSYVLLLLIGVTWGFQPIWIGCAAGLISASELAEALANRISAEARNEYVHAARAEGLSETQILWKHLVWLQGRGLLIRYGLGVFPRVLLVEAALSCLPPGGFGVKEPIPSWGNVMVRPMRDLLEGMSSGSSAALIWNALVPTAAMVGAVWSFSWLGTRLAAYGEGRTR